MWLWIVNLFNGIPWVKVGLFLAAAVATYLLVQGIIDYGKQDQQIKQLKQDIITQHDNDVKAIEALKAQNKLDLAAIIKDKKNALALAESTQKQLNKIKNAPANGNGLTRPVVTDTLNWVRGQHSGRPVSNRENVSAR